MIKSWHAVYKHSDKPRQTATAPAPSDGGFSSFIPTKRREDKVPYRLPAGDPLTIRAAENSPPRSVWRLLLPDLPLSGMRFFCWRWPFFTTRFLSPAHLIQFVKAHLTAKAAAHFSRQLFQQFHHRRDYLLHGLFKSPQILFHFNLVHIGC